MSISKWNRLLSRSGTADHVEESATIWSVFTRHSETLGLSYRSGSSTWNAAGIAHDGSWNSYNEFGPLSATVTKASRRRYSKSSRPSWNLRTGNWASCSNEKANPGTEIKEHLLPSDGSISLSNLIWTKRSTASTCGKPCTIRLGTSSFVWPARSLTPSCSVLKLEYLKMPQ